MGLLDRLLAPLADRMLAKQQESGYGPYNSDTGEMASYDWCRFRGDRHCYVPIGYETNPANDYGPGTETTDVVRPPADRGFCPYEVGCAAGVSRLRARARIPLT
jgi:hypothetical protein